MTPTWPRSPTVGARPGQPWRRGSEGRWRGEGRDGWRAFAMRINKKINIAGASPFRLPGWRSSTSIVANVTDLSAKNDYRDVWGRTATVGRLSRPWSL